MLISKRWLNKYIDVMSIDDETIDKLLSLSGTSIESIEKPWEDISGVYTGTITKIEDHPNADKLIICSVDSKEKTYTIVTGDKSLKEGDSIPLALNGAKLKDGFKINKSKLRGVESEGMMCSLEELNLENKSDSVYRFKESLENGMNVVELFGLKDSVYDLEITANRPDELSYRGIARELKALLNENLEINEMPIDYKTMDKTTSDYMSINIQTPQLCNRYTGLIIEGVKVEESPLWLKRDLISVGLRPVNNVVDITNYILMETGHPIHAFDYDKLENKSIVVRTAKKGEKLLLLNDDELEFDGDEMLITDGTNPLALAGIMGGEGTGVNAQTKTVFLEVAYFNPVKIRKTARKFNLSSDSSYRFERGVDPNDCEYVIKRLANMICELAHGEAASEILDVYPNKIERKTTQLRKQKVSSLLGIEYENSTIERILNSLGFEMTFYAHQQKWDVLIPTYRPDVEREVDLIEEIGRIGGYEKIPSTIPHMNSVSKSRDEYQMFRYNVRKRTVAAGYSEIIPISLIDPDDVKKICKSLDFEWNKNAIEIIKPISKDMSILRPSLLITLFKTIGYNHSHQQSDLKLFENGVCFMKDDSGNFLERESLVMAATGKNAPEDYQSSQKIDFFNFKGSIEEILAHLEIDNEKIVFERPKNDNIYTQIMYPAQSALVLFDNQQIGIFGLVRKEIMEGFSMTEDVYCCEFDMKQLYKAQKDVRRKWRSILGTNFPASKKDFSVLVGRGTEMGRVVKKIKTLKNVESVNIVDVYSGKNIPTGYNSITISVLFRSADHTLSQKELENNFKAVIKLFKEEQLELREG